MIRCRSGLRCVGVNISHRYRRHFTLLTDSQRFDLCSCHQLLACRKREYRNPPQQRREPPSRQVSFRQQQPVVLCMLYQSPTGLHQPLLHAGQRPVLDPARQSQPPPEVSQVEGKNAQPKPNLIASESMAEHLPIVHCSMAALTAPAGFMGAAYV